LFGETAVEFLLSGSDVDVAPTLAKIAPDECVVDDEFLVISHYG